MDRTERLDQVTTAYGLIVDVLRMDRECSDPVDIEYVIEEEDDDYGQDI